MTEFTAIIICSWLAGLAAFIGAQNLPEGFNDFREMTTVGSDLVWH